VGIIHTRHLATSRPRNFTTGLPIFALGSSINRPTFPQNIGGGTPQPQRIGRNPLISVTVPLALWRFTASLGATLFAGSFFGFNLEYDVSGQTLNDGTGFIGVANDFAAGGMGFGVSLGLEGRIRLERSLFAFSFRRGFVQTWEDLFNQAFSFNVDLINAAVTVFNALTGGNVPMGIIRGGRTIGSVAAIWGLFDEVRFQFGTRGRLELRPTLNLSPNILEVIPEMRVVLRKLRKVGLQFSLGPTLNIIYPISVRVVRLLTEDGSYDVARTSGSLQFLQGGPVRTLAPTVSNITVVHSTTVSFEFNLELRTIFTFLGLFGVDHSIPIGVNFQQAGARVDDLIGPFFTALNGGPETLVAETELPEVVWG
jgi:hypothetical protein